MTALKKETAHIHFTHLYPLDQARIFSVFDNITHKCVLVENNSNGQFGLLLSQQTGINIQKKVLRYDGRPIDSRFIINNLNK